MPIKFYCHTKKPRVKKILILGGYGKFGSYIIRNIIHLHNIQVIVNGRSEKKCRDFIQSLASFHNLPLFSAFDINQNINLYLKAIKPDLVVHTAGPFDGQDYHIAKSCIEHDINYIDLSDGREWVTNINKLSVTAKNKDIMILSGASSVPCISSAIINKYINDFKEVNELEYAISTPSYPAPGLATLKSVLGYVGKPFCTLINGQFKEIYGWHDMKTYKYPVVGTRFLSNCDIPDLDLFSEKYTNIRTIRFYAGLGNWMFHCGLWGLSWLVRFRLIKSLQNYAEFIEKLSIYFNIIKTGKSAFHLKMTGIAHNGENLEKTFYLICQNGDGMNIPAIPAIIAIKKFVNEELNIKGVHPFMGILTIEEILDEIKSLELNIRCIEEVK